MEAQPKHTGLVKARERERRVHSFISSCRDFIEQVTDLNEQSEHRELAGKLQGQVFALKTYTLRTLDTPTRNQLEDSGATLWNLCTRKKRQEGEGTSSGYCKVLLLARIYAFLLLALPDMKAEEQPNTIIRKFRLAVKTGRSCIDGSELEFALLALQKAADYNGLLHDLQHQLPEDELGVSKRLEAEHLVLRIILAWKENRLDVAEHIYGKTQSLRHRLEPTTAESLADAIYEIGESCLGKQDFTMATKWLERAYDFLSSQDLEMLSRDGVELQLTISQALVRAFLGLDTAESLQKAESLVASLESEAGDKLVVLLLRLDVLVKAPGEVFDSSTYANVLRRIMRAMDLTNTTFKLMISRIRKLDDKGPALACQVMDEFIKLHVLLSRKDDWIERALTLRIYMSTSQRGSLDTVNGIRSLLDHIQQSLEKPLAAHAALGIITLLWKKIESNFHQGTPDMAQEWCHLALHPALCQCGPVNAAKLARKLLLCALEHNDLDGAKEALSSMSDVAKAQPMTIYLAHKLAVQTGDWDMAAECIERISQSSSKDLKFLYACCIEAHASDDKLSALKALKVLADKHEFNPDSPIHLPALLRVIIRLLMSILSEGSADVDRGLLAEDLCHVFEGVTRILQRDLRDKEGSKLFPIKELDWFCKNAYNTGLKYTESWNLHCVASVFKSCITIISYYPNDLPEQDSGDLALRRLFCNFMLATTYTALARAEDNVEEQLQLHLMVRKHVEAYDSEFTTCLHGLDKVSAEDLRLKMGSLLVFDFEAAVCLKSWDDLPVIARKMGTSLDVETLQAAADCILKAEGLPIQVTYSTLRILINEIWKLECFDIERLAKYMRCLVQVTLPSKTDLSVTVIEDVFRYVKEAANLETPFPPLELEWMAATCFNHGLDLYGSNEDELSRKWVEYALSLAHYIRDEGVLERHLQDRYTSLKWNDPREFNELVNMSASDLEGWLKGESSESAGWAKDDGSGETVGHESGRKIIEILKKNPDKDPSKYDEDDLAHMRKVVAYCKRHLAQEGKAKQDPDSKSARSLKNWGHDPQKAA
ncbi:hypothetical protein PG993_007281 [Apiospora rasikravindrae]|uniref:Protein ZIP4 homolog n=1 Tax=Apiospora rasikravindrae TaxID=990691 RepID=A0ABR1SYV4_9PEZI